MIPLLGPDQINSRIRQLQSRIDDLTNSSASKPETNFQQTLSGVLPADPSSFEVAGSSGQFGPMADEAAIKNGVDPKIFRALVNTESAWNPSATSKMGAKGLCQLMPTTAQSLGVNDVNDPRQSLEGGAKYLKQMLDEFGGDYGKALAAYNAGPGAVRRSGGIPPYQETISYVRKIMGQV